MALLLTLLCQQRRFAVSFSMCGTVPQSQTGPLSLRSTIFVRRLPFKHCWMRLQQTWAMARAQGLQATFPARDRCTVFFLTIPGSKFLTPKRTLSFLEVAVNFNFHLKIFDFSGRISKFQQNTLSLISQFQELWNQFKKHCRCTVAQGYNGYGSRAIPTDLTEVSVWTILYKK